MPEFPAGKIVRSIHSGMITVLVFLFQFTIQNRLPQCRFPIHCVSPGKEEERFFAQDHEAEQEYTEYTKLLDMETVRCASGFSNL